MKTKPCVIEKYTKRVFEENQLKGRADTEKLLSISV